MSLKPSRIDSIGIASDDKHHDSAEQAGPRAVLDEPAPAVPEAPLLRPLCATGRCVRNRFIWGTKKLAAKNAIASTRPASVTGATPNATPTNTPTHSRATATSAARDVLSMRLPTQPSSDGSSVSVASTISNTPTAEPTAMPVTKLRPMSVRPSSEITTVMPANTTARPLVSIDSTTASSTDVAGVDRLPVPGDDEQGVVDADAEADHRDHLDREVRHRHRVAGDRHDRGAGTEAEQGDADRQAHREHRAEREDQDDDRGEDAVDLALGHLELGEDVAAVLDGEAVDIDRLVAHVPDVLAERRRLLEREVLDVELGVGDRAVLADLTRLVVGARQVDRVERVDLGEQTRPSRRPPRDRSRRRPW